MRGPLKLLKEKILSDDDSSLNLLQYVSDFKNRLSKACEAAWSNLKSAQSKMKLCYDENAQDRNFEPGDEVLALLPIPGKPLQARYYGPYTVDKKLSDVNYIVNTPGRRKQKQLCHINMLKKYIDRDSSVISSVNLVSSVPLEQNQMDSEDMNFVKSDPALSKLKNSDILKDLDQKLSYLRSDKRLELKQLILEYEHLFPDIPSKTDKIYHDVDFIDGSFLDGDVPRSTSYGVYISQLIRFARASSYVADFNTRNKLLTQKLLKQGYRYHKLRKTFSKFYRRYNDLISKFQVGLKSLLRQGLSEPDFYGDLVYKLKKIVGSNNFSAQFIKIISHYKKIGYNINVLQQTACLVVNPITVGNFAFLFNCTPVGRTSDSMMVPT